MGFFIRRNGKVSLTRKGREALAGYLFILPFLIGFIGFSANAYKIRFFQLQQHGGRQLRVHTDKSSK